MLSCVIKALLITGLVASGIAAARQPSQSLRPLTQEDRDAALAPLPGVTFRDAPPRSKGRLRMGPKDCFKKTSNYAHLHPYHGPRSGLTSAAATLGVIQRAKGGSGYENITSITAYGTQYGVKVAFGEQNLVLNLDTGSSDTWSVSSRYNCTDWFGDNLPQKYCAFGPSYKGDFTNGAIQEEHLYIRYGDGEVVEGPLGYMDITIGGIPVKNQTVALANNTYWVGNNVSSGILGLAYPSLTNAFYGPAGEHDPYSAIQYSPIFSTMVDQGLVEENFFSIAISRNSSGGAIGFGGVPEYLDGVDLDTTAETDIIIINVADDPYTAYDYSFYTIIPTGWLYGTSTNDMKLPYIVDSGTTLIYLPTQLAIDINNAFTPPAVYSFMFGGYFTKCDAVAPRIAVVIGETPFWLNPKDLVFRELKDPITGLCMTAFGDGGTGPYILGDMFLQNVVAVFNVDDAVMQFASRRFY